MKKSLLTCIALLTVLLALSQTVQRNMVILEIGTGTGCQYCPGSAMGAEDLLNNGANVAVIEYHSYNSNDPFNTPEAAARTSYYGITGYPTAFFDGTVNHVGGSTSASLYTTYLPLYNQQYAVPSPLTIDISGYNTGDNYTITLTINKLATISGTGLKAYLVLTESGIPYAWMNQTEINSTERLMVPTTGTDISFATGNTVTLTLPFTKDPTWITANCELVAFVQDYGTKTIYNGAKKALNALALPLPTNFSGTPTSGCSPLTVNYTDLSTGATSWNWSFPGGTPATSTVQNPVVVYNTAGTFDVTLNAFNVAGNQAGTMAKSAYISVNSAPVAPGMPQGISGLCVNPPTQTYTINTVPNTNSYTWDLSPATAGVLTNNGISCVIDWDNTFTGIAQLKARATNACGNSPWTPYLSITISTEPGQAATPAGPTSLCMNSGNSTYTTTGASNASTYSWDLLPPEAGALYPSGTSLNIAWSATFTGTATLKVKGINNSCEGAWSSPLTINVLAGPTAFNVTGGGAYCAIGGTGVAVGLSGSQPATGYTLYLNNVATTNTVAGTGSAITFGNLVAVGSYTVVASTTSGSCTNTMSGAATVSSDPAAPAVPGAPSGPSSVYSGSTPTTDYTTSGGTYATTYSWEVTPAEAGTMNGATTTGTATWNPAFTGSASVKVKSINACGSSSFSTTFTVAVAAGGVGLQENSGSGLISIFPNPAGSSVTIIPARQMHAGIRVYNSLGSEMITLPDVNLSANYLMDISTLKPGIYFIRISSNDLRQTIKLVVQ
ncbi:MAG: T9SS type A sorting domain-containing protein [Bacteroidetes bacterium]|nr:T9SS type A sorting domain-containing protein [Bacteroidota bacterium]